MPLQLPKTVDLGQNLLTGLKIGSTFRQIGEEREAAQTKTALLEQYAKDRKIFLDNPTAKAAAELSLKYPGQAAGLKQGFEILSKEKQQRAIGDTSKVYSALLANKPEFAQELIGDRINAIEAGGGDSSKLVELSKYIERDPTAAKGLVGLTLSSLMGSENFSKTFKALEDQRLIREREPKEIEKRQAEINQIAKDLGLKTAQINKANAMTKKLGEETNMIVFELAALEGKTDPASVNERFAQEDNLRKQYVARTGAFKEAERVYEIIQVSGADASGAGDVSLVTSFMKMLDPGSVVRESEFATARDTDGLYGQLKSMVEKKRTGQFLTPKQRKDFTRLAGSYMKAAEKQEERVRVDLGKVVKSYGLDAENVFGTIAEEAEEAGVEVGAETTQEATAEKKQPVISVDF